MTYYDRLRREPSAYDSPEDRMESFHRRMEAIERSRLKEEFEFYRKRDMRASGDEKEEYLQQRIC